MTQHSLVLAHLKSFFRRPVAYAKVMLGMRKITDLSRWEEPSNLRPEWDDRTRIIAELVPGGSKVIEFGAARLVLQQYLKPGCTYQPADLVSRSEDTLLLDLNGSLPDLGQRYDVAVFSGVLEYVHDLHRLMQWLQSVSEMVIFSYAVTDHLSDPITRSRNGWVNHLSDHEVQQMVERAHLVCMSKTYWEGQCIYMCRFTAETLAV